ncbi:MAG: DsbE family thiol:disulfide interchange protein [Rhodobacteraceae bacterium]|nr:DsbE family thiol:disulfide interchange protein [Paracoccaceae bacterium]
MCQPYPNSALSLRLTATIDERGKLSAEGKPLPGVPLLIDDDLRSGQVTVLNLWATWCPRCRAEHPVLKDMRAQGIRVAGINIMDDDAKAAAYLAEEGNPFFALATDPQGRNRVEWGVTAPPETFIIRGDGTVAFRFIGPLIGSDYENRFKPALCAGPGRRQGLIGLGSDHQHRSQKQQYRHFAPGQRRKRGRLCKAGLWGERGKAVGHLSGLSVSLTVSLPHRHEHELNKNKKARNLRFGPLHSCFAGQAYRQARARSRST